MATPFNTILTWFETGDFPTQAQFTAAWSSFWHKDETIPMAKIENLSQMFQLTASAESLNAHINDANAHTSYLAKKDASNADREAWRTKLGVGDLPPNLATLQDVANARASLKDELLDGAPAAYDTLKEISNYIASDQSAEAAMLQQIGNKLDKPTADGSWVITKAGTNYTWSNASDFGKNIANSAQTTTAEGGMRQMFPYTWNSNGNSFRIVTDSDYSSATYGSIAMNNSFISLSKRDNNGSSFLVLEGSQVYMKLNSTYFRIGTSGFEMSGLYDRSSEAYFDRIMLHSQGNYLGYMPIATFASKYALNMSNADLTISTARTHTMLAALTFDTLGNPFSIKGLANVGDNFANYPYVLRQDASGKLVRGGALTINVPDSAPSQINNNYTITINSALPSPAPTLPTYQQDLQNFMNTLYSHQFTKMSDGAFSFFAVDGSAPKIFNNNNGVLSFLNSDALYTGMSGAAPLCVSRANSLRLPNNKNWAFMFSFDTSIHGLYQLFEFGFSRQNANAYGAVELGQVVTVDGRIWLGQTTGTNYIDGGCGAWALADNTVIFVKLGDFIHIIVNHNQQQKMASINANTSFSSVYVPTFVIKKSTNSYGNYGPLTASNISYWIEQ